MPRLKDVLVQQGIRASDDGGSERLTIVDGKARGSNTECIAAFVQPHANNSGVIRILISADTDCTSQTGISLSDTGVTNPLIVYVSNLNLLSFAGSNDTDRVDIVYRI